MPRIVCPDRDVDVLTHDPRRARALAVAQGEVVERIVPKSAYSFQGRAIRRA